MRLGAFVPAAFFCVRVYVEFYSFLYIIKVTSYKKPKKQ